LGTGRENLAKTVNALRSDLEESRRRVKELGQRVSALAASGQIGPSADASLLVTNPVADILVSVAPPSELVDEQIISQGQDVVRTKPSTVYVGFVLNKSGTRIICFVGESALKSGYSAVAIVRKFASRLGGSGGGTPSFAQGGGSTTDPDRVREIVKDAANIITSSKG